MLRILQAHRALGLRDRVILGVLRRWCATTAATRRSPSAGR
jgi:hypothetical protein